MDDTGKMREHLTIKIKDEKLYYDNPAMSYEGSNTNSLKCQKHNSNGNNEKFALEMNNKNNLKTVFVPPANSYKMEKEYDPYAHRTVKHPTTYYETLIHMLKASLGTGILAMPDAFHNAGYAVATIGTLAIGFVCTYTIHILISAEYELCRRRKRPYLTYPETAQAAVLEGPKCVRGIAPAVPLICNMFLLLYQIGSCCIYVVFISSNIKDVVDYYLPDHILDIRIYMLFIMAPLILINWVPNLKYLAPLSTLANIVTLASFTIIFTFIFSDLPEIKDREPVADFSRMPLFFGTVLFAMEAIGVVMPLENEMKEPQKFGSNFGVLNCAMLPITLLYTFVGFFGYLKYGSDVKGSITLSLPNDNIFAQAARLMLAFAIYITHALACYVAVDISWREYIEPCTTKAKVFVQYVVRTVIVLITISLAAAIPDLELFIALIGALCLSTMGLSFPALIQLFTFWHDYKSFRFVLFFLKNLTIILISLLGFVIGTYTSIKAINLKFSGH